MRVLELVLRETEPAARGAELGRLAGAEIAETVRGYLRIFRTFGIPEETVSRVARQGFEALAGWAPAQAEELAAVAGAAGVAVDDLAALVARTEILAHEPVSECTTAVALRPGRAPSTIQTWDWYRHLAPTATLLAFSTAGGISVRTFAETGMLAKIGVNDTGVGVHFNMLGHTLDGTAPGVPIHAVVRRILEEARGVDDAVQIVRSAAFAASSAITVVDRTGSAASIEVSPAGIAVIAPTDGLLVRTNHFLDPRLAAGGVTHENSTTGQRFVHARRTGAGLAQVGDLASAAAVFCGEQGAAAPVCARPDLRLDPDHRWETLLTISIDLDAVALHWHPGLPSDLSTAAARLFPA